MSRGYDQKRRAEQVEDTRRRIVEAAIELHQELGPAQTSVSAIAERAGVQRQTYYRHFPDQRSLLLACSGLYQERNPLPDPASLRAIANPHERLLAGIAQLYAYYDANEAMLANIIRDAEADPLVGEVAAMRLGVMAELCAVLGQGLGPKRRPRRVQAALELALDFNTWRLLVRRNGLTPQTAGELMASVIRCLS